MSNYWYGRVLVPTHTASEQLSALLARFSVLGYALAETRADVGQMVTSSGDTNTFASNAEMMTQLLEAGGLVTLKKTGSFDLRFEYSTVESRMKSRDSADVFYAAIGVFFTQRDLAAPLATNPREEVAALFNELCHLEAGVYSYLGDDETREPFIGRIDLDGRIRDHRLPSILFWWNYFPNRTGVTPAQAQLLTSMGSTLKPLRGGVLLMFSETPWLENSSRMRAINKQWESNGVPE
jgi:hypothetical protein